MCEAQKKAQKEEPAADCNARVVVMRVCVQALISRHAQAQRHTKICPDTHAHTSHPIRMSPARLRLMEIENTCTRFRPE